MCARVYARAAALNVKPAGSSAKGSRRSSLRCDKPHCNPKLRLFGIDISADTLQDFATCFENRGMRVSGESAEQSMPRQSFVNACVLALNGDSIKKLSASKEFADGHGFIFGIGSDQQILSFPNFHVNILLREPTQTTIHAAVEKSSSVLCRRVTVHDRIPIATKAIVSTGAVALNGVTLNIGCGGIAVRLRRAIDLPRLVSITWDLPGSPSISLDAEPRWSSGPIVGFRFVSRSPAALKCWIHNYSARLGVTSVI